MSRCPSSYSNRILLALAASLAMHGLLFLTAPCPRSSNMDARVSPASAAVSVRLLALTEARASRPAVVPALVKAARTPPAVGQKAAVDTEAPVPTRDASADAPMEDAPMEDLPMEDLPSHDSGADSVEALAGRDIESAVLTTPAEGGSPGPREVSFAEAASGLGLPMPAYPEIAKRWGLEGAVLIRIHVAPDGRVSGTEVLRSSGHEILDSACLNTIRKKWKFPAPGRDITVSKEFVFNLRR